MTVTPGTQIGSDGVRYPSGTQPTADPGFGIMNFGSLDTAIEADALVFNATTGLWEPTAQSGGGGSGIPTTERLVAVKLSDESRMDTTTLADDSALTFSSVEANSTWLIDGYIVTDSASVSPDIKLALTASDGGAVVLTSFVGSASSASGPTNTVNMQTLASNESGLRGLIDSGRPLLVIAKGTFVVGGSASDLALRWAQNVSGSVATTVKANSWLRLMKVP